MAARTACPCLPTPHLPHPPPPVPRHPFNPPSLPRIVVWTSSVRFSVETLFTTSGEALDTAEWQVMESRLLYALTTYPWVQLQVILYVELFVRVCACARLCLRAGACL